MNTLHTSQRTVLRSCIYFLVAVLCSCGPGPASHCTLGSQISIPGSDSSAPVIVGIDFHMPDGSLVSRKPGDGLPNQITVPSNGDVTVILVVEDPEGVQDSQLFVAPIDCTFDPATNLASCSGPGLLSGPTASNPETNAVGGAGCTQRLATQTISITESATASKSAEVSAKGINFGGQESNSLIYTLSR